MEQRTVLSVTKRSIREMVEGDLGLDPASRFLTKKMFALKAFGKAYKSCLMKGMDGETITAVFDTVKRELEAERQVYRAEKEREKFLAQSDGYV